MAGTCECGNEHSGSVKWEEFLTSCYLLASKEGLCSVELGVTSNREDTYITSQHVVHTLRTFI